MFRIQLESPQDVWESIGSLGSETLLKRSKNMLLEKVERITLSFTEDIIMQNTAVVTRHWRSVTCSAIQSIFVSSLLLGFAACTNTPPQPPLSDSPHLGLSPTITGTVAGYPFGQSTIELSGGLPLPRLEAGSIAPGGKFSVTLPANGLSTFSNTNYTCVTGSITTVPAETLGSILEAGSGFGNITQSEEQPQNPVPGQSYLEHYRYWVDQDVVINSDCQALTNTVSKTSKLVSFKDLSLKKGWNEVTVKRTFNATSDFDEEFSLGIPSNQAWRLGGTESF
jgi:hypothetical protein